MKYFVFNNLGSAQTAANWMYINALETIADRNNGTLITNLTTGATSIFDSLTFEEKLDTKILGVRNNIQQLDNGLVSSIVKIKKSYNLDIYYFENIERYSKSITGYIDIIEEIPNEWHEPFVIATEAEFAQAIINGYVEENEVV